MRHRKSVVVIVLCLTAVSAFSVLVPFIPATVGSDYVCTPQQSSLHDFNWGTGGCYSPGFASLTMYVFHYGAYYTLGTYVPPVARGRL
jgi:hypothetical protein